MVSDDDIDYTYKVSVLFEGHRNRTLEQLDA